MKVAVARVYHETNTFNPVAASLENLQLYGYQEGDQMLEPSFISSEMAGAVAAAQKLGIELSGLITANGWAGGKLKQDDYQYLKSRLLERLERSLPVDGVYLALHGAMVGEDEDDAEGDILAAVRRRVGEGAPLVVSCDMHANVTERMVRQADFLVGYHTCPHLDTEQIGFLALEAVYEIITRAAEPVVYWCKLPMITPADLHNTFSGPLRLLFDRVAEVEADPDVWCASIFPVQPWLDVPELGWAVVLTARRETARGPKYCQELAGECWRRRQEFEVAKLTASQAVSRANSTPGRPVVIADGADATSAGAAGNSTHLLSELLSQGTNGQALLPLIDPAMAGQAHQAGIGGAVEGEVGRRPDNPFSSPVHIQAEVLALSDGRFTISGHGGRNLSVHMGKTAALGIGELVLVVSERAGPGHDPLLFSHLGFDPKNAKIVIVKSPVGFRAAYEPFAQEIILADTPGAASSDLRSLGYSKRPRPLHPFEQIAEPQFSAQVRAGRLIGTRRSH